MDTAQVEQVGISEVLEKPKYQDSDNSGNPKSAFMNKVVNADKQTMMDLMDEYIWLSAYANNNPQSDYHWKCDATFDIGDIHFPGLYDRRHKLMMKDLS